VLESVDSTKGFAAHGGAADGAIDVGAPPCSPPLNMDFLARRSEAREALEHAPNYAMGLVEAGAVADGAGAAERLALNLVSVPAGQTL